MAKESKKAQRSISGCMHKWGEGKLHSGSKKGPIVRSQKQAEAIGISEARKKGYKVGKRGK